MKKRYTSSDLAKLHKDKKWVMKYNHLYGVIDPKSKKVLYIENYGPNNGFFIEAWRHYHFPRTSSIVEKSYREGNNSLFVLKQGRANLSLIPSFAPIGIEACEVKGQTIHITIAGLGGGGVSASFSRGMADGVNEVIVLEEGGGERIGKAVINLPTSYMLLIGVDDTDNETEGATYSLAHNIALDIEKRLGAAYVIHNNIQLYPNNPNKTKNCMATVIGFIYKPKGLEDRIIKDFTKQLKEHTVSNETAIAIYNGFIIPEKLHQLSKKVKTQFINDSDNLIAEAKTQGVKPIVITGKGGLIGAIGALGYYDKPLEAVELK